jgi:ubiquinone/menaquinone biosynthesis C-methylase UbiE
MDMPADTLHALIELHRGLERQGPGDAAFARALLHSLPPLPASPRIADLGCGSGAAALMLASHFAGPILAVDLAQEFLDELETRATAAGVADRVTAIQADMGALNWPPKSIDLLWSEGAAYSLGFERALTSWRPLLADDGIAVVSEMSWFTRQPAPAALAFWKDGYPTMADEAENRERALRAGYRVLDTLRLPSQAWWDNYYGPLRHRMQTLVANPVLQAVIQETTEEMALFEQFSDQYGYVFYVLAANGHPAPTSPGNERGLHA